MKEKNKKLTKNIRNSINFKSTIDQGSSGNLKKKNKK